MKATRRIVPGEVILADYGDRVLGGLARGELASYVIFREAVRRIFGIHCRGSDVGQLCGATRRFGWLVTANCRRPTTLMEGGRSGGKLPWTGAR